MSAPTLHDVRAAARLAGMHGDVELHATIGSTNDRAHELAQAGAPHGTLVVANEQTAGRGRRGRVWESPAGLGIYTSVVVRWEVRLPDAPLLVAAVGLGLAEGLERAAPRLSVQLKWPNDLWCGRRKLGGVLVEARSTGYLVAGFGLNLSQAPRDFGRELADSSTSVAIATGSRHPHMTLFAGALRGMWERTEQVLDAGPMAELEAEYRRRSALIGGEVELQDGSELVRGVVVDLSASEGLLLRTASGAHRHVRAEFASEVRPVG